MSRLLLACMVSTCLLLTDSVWANSSRRNKGRPWGTFSDANKTYTVPGEYLVMLYDGTATVSQMESLGSGILSPAVRTMARSVIGGKQFFTVTASDDDLDKLRALPEVRTMEPNRMVFAFDLQPEATAAPVATATCTAQDASLLWGLDRVDQREKTLYNLAQQYVYGTYSGTGSGVNVYVTDSGVNIADPEFGGRAIWGYTAPDMGGDVDLNGHGTHVAGTVGASTYGVAKQANIIAVKVLDAEGTGSSTGFIAGLEWIANDFSNRGRPNSVINLSLGVSGISSTVDNAIQSVIDAGITVVAAAGNEYDNACNYSPAHTPDVITVGATGTDDIPTVFTNWGTCLDLWAPGEDILSTTPTGPQSFQGTSMAAPHVTGVIARYLSTMTSYPTPTPAKVADWLEAMTTKDRVIYETNVERTSPNRLLYIDCADYWTTPKPPPDGSTTALPGGSTTTLPGGSTTTPPSCGGACNPPYNGASTPSGINLHLLAALLICGFAAYP